MSTLKEIITPRKDFKSYARLYARYVARLLEDLDLDALEALLLELGDARKNKKKVFVIGNGGSAATASHLANDFALGKGGDCLRVISLADNVSVLTAIANDRSFEEIFSKQLQVYWDQGDKLLVISASGNSPNLVRAANWVKEQKGTVLGFLGFDGGKLKGLCDVSILIRTPKGEYGPVEDVHMVLDHLLSVYFNSESC